MPQPRSLKELATVAGASDRQVRAAVADGYVDPSALSWADALILRVLVPVQSLMLVGEPDPRVKDRPANARVLAATRIVKEAVAQEGLLNRNAVLAVGRTGAFVYPTISGAARQHEPTLYDEGMLFALPIGQWWADLRWRATEEEAC